MPKTCAEAIAASLTKIDRMPVDTGWQERHRTAWGPPIPYAGATPARNFELAIVTGIQAAALYADAHQARYDSPIGDDGVLGPCFRDWLTGLRGLLNGETGRLDCGTVDGLILEIARIAGLEDFDA